MSAMSFVHNLVYGDRSTLRFSRSERAKLKGVLQALEEKNNKTAKHEADLAALVAERDSLRKRNREMCQALVNAVGADGPCNAEDAAAKLVSERDALVKEVEALSAERDDLEERLGRAVERLCELEIEEDTRALNNIPHPLMTMYRVLLSLPLAICWMLTFAVLCAGWGLSRGDKFIELWYSVVVDEDDDHLCGPDGCGNDDDKCFCNIMQNG